MSQTAKIDASFAGVLEGFTLDASFTVPAQGVTALFGPSGCGKTSVLRCMAGLQKMSGALRIGGETWQDSSQEIFRRPHERAIGYVFQEASLFAHLNVRDNLLFGARRSSAQQATAGIAFETLTKLLNIAHLLERAPLALSGGERQRVAIGRALLSNPRILLMDEPLSALDQMTKDELLPYLETLHEELAIPVFYVSHDMREVERLADTLVLMDNGKVTACGPLAQLQADPALPLLAAPDAAVMLEGVIENIDPAYGLTMFDIPGGQIIASGHQGTPGEQRRLRIAASDVSFARSKPDDSTILNILPALVETIRPHDGGPQVDIIATLGANGEGARIIGRITRRSLDHLSLSEGAQIYAQIKGVAIASSGNSKFKNN